jgi:DinB superfamily
MRKQVLVTNDELLCGAVFNSWKLVLGRADQSFMSLTDVQFQQPVAPGKNRLLYLLGHLTVVHDRMFPLLGLGGRKHSELDEYYLDHPDRALPDPLSVAALKIRWTEVNSDLATALGQLTPTQWLERHQDVSEEDFAKDPRRNRLAVVMARTNHLSFHLGQMALAKRAG